jgi:SPP1 gp7 family putative phage head morphogenesis protein
MISNNIDHFGALAQTQTHLLQHQGAQLGVKSGSAQLQASKPASIHYTFGVPSQTAITNIVGATRAGSPLQDLFDGFGAEAAEKAGQALITGVTLGDNPRKIAGDVQDALDISRTRALVISRNEMLRAYKNASMETYRANSDVLDGWVWVCDLSPRSCAACISMNGSVHDLSEDLDGHVGCRCAKSPLTKSWDDILSPLGIDTSSLDETSIDLQSGSDWFDEQDEATQRSILGSKAAYDLYSSGDASLSDFVGIHSDPDWGKSIYQKSVKQVVR